MRIELDATMCQAYGNCLLAAPEAFALDSTMPVVEVLLPAPPETMRSEVEEAVRSCPVEALTLHEF